MLAATRRALPARRTFPRGRRGGILIGAVGMALALTTTAQAATECSYEERIVVLSDSIAILGEDVGGAIDNAADKTDMQLARQFTSFGRRLGRNERRVANLDPRQALETAHEELRDAIRPVRRDLFGIARAARSHNAEAARSWTRR